ncbi:annexin A4-like [Styela clava]
MSSSLYSNNNPGMHSEVSSKGDSNFNAERDLDALLTHLSPDKGNEDVVISLVTSRTVAQRQAIVTEYEDMNGESIVAKLRRDRRFGFPRLMIALFMSPREYDAQTVRSALHTSGTDEKTLLEIFLTRTNREIQTLKEIYFDKYNHELESDLGRKTTGYFRAVITKLALPSRMQNAVPSTERAKQDAEDLSKALEKKSKKSVFIHLFCYSSYFHLLDVFDAYEIQNGKSIEKVIEKEFKGHLQDSLKAIASITRSPATYFAQRLYESMIGEGHNMDMLVRIVVTRCEVDMPEIKDVFLKTYGVTLKQFIEDETTSTYRQLLLALID